MSFTACSGNWSRSGRREHPEVWPCVEGGRMGCFDRNTQQPRVYALEGEFIYLHNQRIVVNWKLACPHTLSLVSMCDTIGFDERSWSEWGAAAPINSDGSFTPRSSDGKTRLLILARSLHAELSEESAEC